MDSRKGTIHCSFAIILFVAYLHGRSLALEESLTILRDDIHDSGNGFLVDVVRPLVQDPKTARRIHFASAEQEMPELLEIQLRPSLVVMDLELNKNLLPRNLDIRHQMDGKQDIWRPESSIESFSCHYRGTIRNISKSWVTLSICSGISGVAFDGHNVFYIEPLNETNSLDGQHSWTLHGQRNVTLSRSHNEFRAVPLTSTYGTKVKRHSNPEKSVVSRYNLKLLLVVDYTIYRRNNGRMVRILRRALDIANGIHQIYSSLGVSVVLVGVVVWSEGDEILIDRDASTTLAAFQKYNVKHFRNQSHDTAILMTGKSGDFFGGPVGRAYVGTLCNSPDSSCGIAVDNTRYPAIMTSSIMAHEMGHNFGMDHDQDVPGCHCSKEDECVMSKAIGRPTMEWSSCSKETIRNSVTNRAITCLQNPINTCGNMVVEPGEDCDCGLPIFCQNRCCDPVTCKFNKNSPPATCASGECCNLLTCQFEIAGAECRPVADECDLPEYCSGLSAKCPSDLYKYDGIPCQPRKLCLERKCQSSNRVITCPANCTNNGVCNNLGKCHCKVGFHPPDCQAFGLGGSEDGGFGWSPENTSTFYLELYIIFLAIFPILAFLLFCFYYFLNGEQKNTFWVRVDHVKSRLLRKDRSTIFAGLRPLVLNPSISVDKSTDQLAEKRDFSKWVKSRVRLTLPSINIPLSNDSTTPTSGCTTATTMISEVNTPVECVDETLLPPGNCHPRLPIEARLLTPPTRRIFRPPPTTRSDNFSTQDVTPGNSDLSLQQREPDESYDRPLPPLPNSTKPRLFSPPFHL